MTCQPLHHKQKSVSSFQSSTSSLFTPAPFRACEGGVRTAISDQEKFDKIIVVSIRSHACCDICEMGGGEQKRSSLHRSWRRWRRNQGVAWSLALGVGADKLCILTQIYPKGNAALPRAGPPIPDQSRNAVPRRRPVHLLSESWWVPHPLSLTATPPRSYHSP
jgi:hypothetical protein